MNLHRQIYRLKKQFPEGSVNNLIYVNIPSGKGDEFLKCCDESYDLIYHRLNNDSTKVQALILTGMVSQIQSSIRPIAFHHRIVPNYNVAQSLSPRLEIVGAKSIPTINGEFNFKKGSTKFECCPDEGWRSNVTVDIFEVISHDGKNQLMIWKTWRDTFRIEYVSARGGRKVAESEKIDFTQISINEDLLFIARWSEDILDLYLNRKKIAANYKN